MLFVYILADIIHLMKIKILCDMFFAFHKRERRHNRLFLMLAGFAMCLVSTFIYFYDNHILETFIYILAIFLLMCLLYEEKIYSLFTVAMWMILALSMIYTMTSVLYDMSMDLFKINGEIYSEISVPFISLMLVYIVGRIYKKNTTAGIKLIGIANLFWFTILLAVDTYVVTVMAHINVDLYMEDKRNLYLLAVVFVILGIFIQLAAVILLFTQRNVYKEKEQIIDKYLNDQKNHYVYLETREQETKKFRHDLRSHMELISNLAKNREYEKIDSYLEKMNIKIDSFGNIITVQNGIVDAIINQYYEKAQQSGVTMEVRGRFPEECAIDAYDLCTIFSNVLSNALEAAIETEEKTISLECRYNDKNIIIVVKNSYNSEQQNGTSQWRTRKENTDYHGYGLENMRDSVEKYNGVFDIETNNNIFTLTILFNNMGKQGYENCNC